MTPVEAEPIPQSSGSSYIDFVDADTYFEGRLHTEAWDVATEANKQKALIMGTRLVDRLNYIGDKAVAVQELQFPRDDDSEIPDDIKNACCEIALALLDGVDPDLEFENLTMTQLQMGQAKSTYDRSTMPEHILSGIPSVAAWRYLKPFLRDFKTVDLDRVS